MDVYLIKTDPSRFDLLTLHRKTTADNLFAHVPVPKRSVPVNAPPIWRSLPLESKLPMVQLPKGLLTFSRNKLGNPIYNPGRLEFDLSDPYGVMQSNSYDPMHDKNMSRSYRTPASLKRFKELGLIDNNEEVLCGLKEFNQYRNYLRKMQLNEVMTLQKKMDELELDRRNLRNVDQLWNKQKVKLAKRAERIELKQKYYIQTENRYETRLQAALRAQERNQRALKKYELLKASRQEDTEYRGFVKQNIIKEHQDKIIKNERRRSILLKKRIAYENDLIKLRTVVRKMRSMKEKNEKITQRWNKKMAWLQQKDMYNNYLLDSQENKMRCNIRRRDRWVKLCREKDQQGIIMKRANLIRERYEERTPETLAMVYIEELHKYMRSLEIENEKIRRAPKIKLNLNIGDLPDITTWDLSGCVFDVLAQTFGAKDEICGNDQEKGTQKSPRPCAKSEGEPVSTNPSCNASATGNENNNENENENENENADSQHTLHRYSSELSFKKDPADIVDEVLFDLSEAGPDLVNLSFKELTNNDIKSAIFASYNKTMELRGSVNTFSVLLEANSSLKRMSAGFNDEIPRDEAVLVFVTSNLSKSLHLIVDKHSADLENKVNSGYFEQEAKKYDMKRIRRESNAPKKTVRFTDDTWGGGSNFPDPTALQMMKKPIEKVQMKHMVRQVFITPEAEEKIELPPEMLDRKLMHLYKYQKFVIMENLSRLQSCVDFKVGEYLQTNIKHGAITIEIKKEDKPIQKLVDLAVDIMLTLPEKNLSFAKVIIEISNAIGMKLLRKLEKLFKLRIEQKRRKRQPSNPKMSKEYLNC